MGFSVMPGSNPLFHSIFLYLMHFSFFFFFFFFASANLDVFMQSHTYHACSILFKMTAITTSSISIKTAVMIARLVMNQTATVKVMQREQLGIMFVL